MHRCFQEKKKNNMKVHFSKRSKTYCLQHSKINEENECHANRHDMTETIIDLSFEEFIDEFCSILSTQECDKATGHPM